MTANQLAMNANAETMRHNANVEWETKEHNRNLENIQQQSNEIELKKNEWLDQRERDKLAWQKEYDTKYLELQRSQGDRRLEIEQQLANIRDQEVLNEKNYKQGMLDYNQQMASLQSKRDAEVLRHNQELEKLQSSSIANEAYRNELIKEQNSLTQFQNYSNYVLGLREVGLKARDVYTREQSQALNAEYQETMLGVQKAKAVSETVSNYLDSTSKLINSGANLFHSVNADLGGINYGTKQKQALAGKAARAAAEALFK